MISRIIRRRCARRLRQRARGGKEDDCGRSSSLGRIRCGGRYFRKRCRRHWRWRIVWFWAGVFRAQQLGDENRLEPEAVAESVRGVGKKGASISQRGRDCGTTCAEAESGDVLLVMSNGSFDGLCEKLLAKLGSRCRFLPRQIPGESKSSRGPGHSSRQWRILVCLLGFTSPSQATIHYEVSISHPEQHLISRDDDDSRCKQGSYRPNSSLECALSNPGLYQPYPASGGLRWHTVKLRLKR